MIEEGLGRRAWQSLCRQRFSVLDMLALSLFSCAVASRVWIAVAMFTALLLLVALVRADRKLLAEEAATLERMDELIRQLYDKYPAIHGNTFTGTGGVRIHTELYSGEMKARGE